MRILLYLIRAYIWLMVVWAIMTWIPGVAGSPVHNLIGIPIVPVLNLFSFASIGFVGLQAIIVIGILWLVEAAIERKLKRDEGTDAPQPAPQAEDRPE